MWKQKDVFLSPNKISHVEPNKHNFTLLTNKKEYTGINYIPICVMISCIGLKHCSSINCSSYHNNLHIRIVSLSLNPNQSISTISFLWTHPNQKQTFFCFLIAYLKHPKTEFSGPSAWQLKEQTYILKHWNKCKHQIWCVK